MQTELVIFDLDGTLVDTIVDLGQACNYALAKLGLMPHSIDDYKQLVGNGIMRLIQKALPERLREEPELVAQMRKHFMDYYDQHLYDFSVAYQGIDAVLAFLKAAGCRLAVASNKYQAATERIIEHFFPKTFDIVFGEREGIPRKPDVAVIDDIFKTIPLGRSACVYMIGDSLVDIATAKNAGIPIIACSWGFVPRETLKQETVDGLVDSPKALLAFLQLH